MLADVWSEFIKVVQDEVGSCIVETWFKAVTIERWDSVECVVELSVPNAFVGGWVKTHYTGLLQLHLGRLLSAEIKKIVFVEVSRKSEPSGETVIGEISEPKTSRSAEVVPARAMSRGCSVPAERDGSYDSHISSRYQFESFIVGPSNSLAYAAAMAVTEKPGKIYNPLFIYGRSGLGKTHLLHAIGNKIREVHKGTNVLYQTANRFVNEFISAIRFDRIDRFQTKYRDVDVLLVDDVQFMSNKEQTQEAFFHVFNSLHESCKQVVFSGDVFPRDLDGMAERLRSRMEWGLVADVQVPSHETKIAILRNKAERSGETVSDDVFDFIASHVISNVRELEGALVRVVAFANLTKQPVSIDIAKRVISRADVKSSKAADFSQILRCVCRRYSVSTEAVKSESRAKNVVVSRQVAMYLMKTMTSRSLREISSFLNRRDHSTVVHAIGKIGNLAESNRELAGQIQDIREKVLSGISD